jgi:hypothetical protein
MTRPKMTKRPLWLHGVATALLIIATLISSPKTAFSVYILIIVGMVLTVIAWVIAQQERAAVRQWVKGRWHG